MTPLPQNEESPRTDLPVLVTAFNRVDTLTEVIAGVRRVRPPRLYLAVDGPRPDRPGEDRQVAAVQDFLDGAVDWDCEVKRLYRDHNLGCAGAVSGAVSWFFEQEERGVVLEDDCLPDPSFFGFCEELLDRYADDPQVMHISGCCLADFDDRGETYFFSLYPQVWGWATWRDRWREFSLDRPDFQDEVEGVLSRFASREERDYWRRVLGRTFSGEIDSWAYPWAYSIWRSGGIATYPTLSLVKNIGFGNDATHTKAWKDFRGVADWPLESVDSVEHPTSFEIDRVRDAEVFRQSYRKPAVPIRALKALSRMLRNR